MDRKSIREMFVGVANRVENRHLEIAEAHVNWDTLKITDASALKGFHHFAESLRELAHVIDGYATELENGAKLETPLPVDKKEAK